MSGRIRVGVLLGGASAERDISLASGHMIAENLPRDRYEVVTLDPLALMARNPRLTPALREKAWALVENRRPQEALSDGKGELPADFREQVSRAAAAAAPATPALVPSAGESRGIDVAFLALHGRYGEDGTLQGLLDLLGIPYVGSGTLASALAMDKAMAKKVLAADGLPVAAGTVVERAAFHGDPEGEARRAAAAALPAVVKPVTQGSSVGLTLVRTAGEMRPALERAFLHDTRALVEERLCGTEITVGVIGNRELQALPVVEIVPKHGLFDYQAKYDPELSEEICPARIPDEAARAAQELGVQAHRSLSCRGFSRCDMILTSRGPVVLEVNTLPGMTVNSLLPKAARVAGIPFPELLDRLVRLALEPEE
jgi:D-alanine-D-alanine ligase